MKKPLKVILSKVHRQLNKTAVRKYRKDSPDGAGTLKFVMLGEPRHGYTPKKSKEVYARHNYVADDETTEIAPVAEAIDGDTIENPPRVTPKKKFFVRKSSTGNYFRYVWDDEEDRWKRKGGKYKAKDNAEYAATLTTQ